MDRETVIAFAVSVIALTLISAFYLSPTQEEKEQAQREAAMSAGEKAENARLTASYSKDDIRYKFQQDALKAAKHKRPAPTYNDDTPAEPSKNEEPPLE